MTDLAKLIERVEKASGPDRLFDGDLHNALFGTAYIQSSGSVTGWMRSAADNGNPTVPRYTASIDAALALTEQVLPGWVVDMSTGNKWAGDKPYASMNPEKQPFPAHLDVWAEAATLPLAIVLATLKALQAKQQWTATPSSAAGSRGMPLRIRETDMKSTILAAMAIAALTAPAPAASLGDVYSQLGGYTCSGSTCTHKDPGTTTVTTLGAVPPGWNAPAIAQDDQHCTDRNGHTFFNGAGFKGGDMCAPRTITEDMNHGRFAPINSATVGACITTTKTLDHNGADFNSGWSISTSTSATPGGC